MDEVTFAREVIALHPRALVAWTNDVGPIPTGENVKIVRYGTGNALRESGTLGHVQDLPLDGTPGRVFKLDIDSLGLLCWSDNAKPRVHVEGVVNPSPDPKRDPGGSSDISPISREPERPKGITFKTTVEIIQLPRMIGYREKQAEQAKAREIAVREIAAQKEERIAIKLAALAERLGAIDDPRAVACYPTKRTRAEDLEIRAKRIERKRIAAEARLDKRARGERRRAQTNEAMRRYGLRPVARWRT